MKDCVFIMFDEISKVLIPVSQGLFSVSQFKSEKKLNSIYSGNWILFPDGVVKSIKRIDITGYHGDTLWTKIFGVLNSTHNVNVEMIKINPNLDTLLEKTKAYLQNDLCSEEPYMQRQDLSKLNSLGFG